MELISVIVPIYKVEKYLERCVESICNQTYKNLEIILIDDESPDTCGEICDYYAKKDDRIKVLHKKNGGLSDARNMGIEASTGDYLTFVDSDDWIDPNMIEILLELCVDYNADLSECEYKEVYSKTRIKNHNNSEAITIMNSIEALESMLDWKYFKPMAWGKLYRRGIIDGIRYPLNKLHEDEYTTYKFVFNSSRLVHIDLAKYNYCHMREDSITSCFKIDNLDACEAFLERRNFFKEHQLNTLEEKMNNAYCIVVLDCLYQCYKNNIYGNKLALLTEQIKKDINYLKKRPIDIFYINELTIASQSLKKYGLHREESETNIEGLSDPKIQNESIEDLKRENVLLKERINGLLNSKTWRYAEKLKQILKISSVTQHWKRRETLKSIMLEDKAKRQELEFDYGHLLYEAEYKFLKYKTNREKIYPLDITKIKLPYEKDMVSIVLPVYNGEDYVSLSIDSVLEQTYNNFEFIIINDGSTDLTPRIIDEYAKRDSRIRVIHQENCRLPRTLSNGFRIARGEFLTWTSADNIMHEDFLERFVDDMQKNSSVGMIWGNMRLIDENGDPISDNQWYANAEFPEEVMFPRSILELNVKANNYIGAAFMYRAICANIVMDYSAFKFCTEDYDYWMKINDLCTLRHTTFADALYSYRFHSKSLTSKDKELKITENRYKLMLLDDFRRDYYLKPLVWTFWGIENNYNLYNKLKTIIQKMGNLILDYDTACKLDENFYERIIIVAFDEEYQEVFIKNAYKVFISDLERSLKAEWDCCIICDTNKKNLQNLGEYKGWYVIEDENTMFSFIDAKAKTSFLYALEEKMDYSMINNESVSVLLIYSGLENILENSLFSIKSQDSGIEVVVITSIENDNEGLERIQIKYPDVIIVRSPFNNFVTMFNCGIWKSNGEILVFGQDDYIFDFQYFLNLKEVMKEEVVKAVCGSVKIDKDIPEDTRNLLGDHRFYLNRPIKKLNEYCGFNVAIKREEVLMIGGLYHLSPELNDVAISASMYGLTQIIHNYNVKSVYENKDCTVYRQKKQVEVSAISDLQKSKLMGIYALEQNLILPYNTYPETLSKNSGGINNDAFEYFLSKVRDDFFRRSQVDKIRKWYNGLATPLISIIVPIYNTQKELKRCVDSIVNQTLHNIEIILVDDGSKDMSGELCDEYAKEDNRIVVIHKENGGLSDARNAGIDCAVSDYILFVDSDDWIDEDMCETLLNIAKQEEADIVECSYRSIFPDHIEEETDNTGEIIVGDSIFALRGQLEWKYFKSVAWNKLYHHSIFADGKRYPKGKYHEDEFFTHQAFFTARKLVYVDISKYNYWHGRESSITSKVRENILDSCYALRSRVDFVMEKGLIDIEKETKNMYCWMLFDRLYKCYKANINGSKLAKLLEDIKNDDVLSWDISDEYKTEYKILLKSYKLFGQCREDDALYEKTKERINRRK